MEPLNSFEYLAERLLLTFQFYFCSFLVEFTFECAALRAACCFVVCFSVCRVMPVPKIRLTSVLAYVWCAATADELVWYHSRHSYPAPLPCSDRQQWAAGWWGRLIEAWFSLIAMWPKQVTMSSCLDDCTHQCLVQEALFWKALFWILKESLPSQGFAEGEGLRAWVFVGWCWLEAWGFKVYCPVFPVGLNERNLEFKIRIFKLGQFLCETGLECSN